MSTKKNTTAAPMTAAQRVSILNRGTTNGGGYPWAAATQALTLAEELGLTWPASTEQAFTDAREAFATLDVALKTDARVGWEMLTAPDAVDQLRALLTARAVAGTVDSVRPEANQAASLHIAGQLTADAPHMLQALATYAAEHADDRRLVGVTGHLPADLAAKVNTWAKIDRLHVALLSCAEGESVSKMDLPAGWSWTRLYAWEPSAWVEFTDMHTGPADREANLHSYAMMRGMSPDLATSLDQVVARAESNLRARTQADKDAQAAAEHARLTARRPAPHIAQGIPTAGVRGIS